MMDSGRWANMSPYTREMCVSMNLFDKPGFYWVLFGLHSCRGWTAAHYCEWTDGKRLHQDVYVVADDRKHFIDDFDSAIYIGEGPPL